MSNNFQKHRDTQKRLSCILKKFSSKIYPKFDTVKFSKLQPLKTTNYRCLNWNSFDNNSKIADVPIEIRDRNSFDFKSKRYGKLPVLEMNSLRELEHHYINLNHVKFHSALPEFCGNCEKERKDKLENLLGNDEVVFNSIDFIKRFDDAFQVRENRILKEKTKRNIYNEIQRERKIEKLIIKEKHKPKDRFSLKFVGNEAVELQNPYTGRFSFISGELPPFMSTKTLSSDSINTFNITYPKHDDSLPKVDSIPFDKLESMKTLFEESDRLIVDSIQKLNDIISLKEIISKLKPSDKKICANSLYSFTDVKAENPPIPEISSSIRIYQDKL